VYFAPLISVIVASQPPPEQGAAGLYQAETQFSSQRRPNPQGIPRSLHTVSMLPSELNHRPDCQVPLPAQQLFDRGQAQRYPYSPVDNFLNSLSNPRGSPTSSQPSRSSAPPSKGSGSTVLNHPQTRGSPMTGPSNPPPNPNQSIHPSDIVSVQYK